MDVYTRAHSHPEAANLWLAEAAVEQGRAAFQHRPALPSEDAASRRAARGTRRGSGRWGRGEGEHPKPDPGTPRLSADISWHGHPGTPGHNLLSRCLQNRQRAQEMIGEGGGSALSHCPEGLRHPVSHGWGCREPPGPWHGSMQPHSWPSSSPRDLLSSSWSWAAMRLGVPPRARLSPLLQTSRSPKDGAVKYSAEPLAFITP